MHFTRFLIPVLLFLASSIQAQDSYSLPEKIVFQNPNPFAVVAGGSKGIGFAIAEALARRNYNLILIARGKDGLSIAKEKLKKYNVQVELIAEDLSRLQIQKELGDWCMANDVPVKMLCNVAGLGGDEDFLNLEIDSVRYMMHLNLESPVLMTNYLLQVLEKNRKAYIMNVASMAAFGPIPAKNIYSSTKAALLYFSYNLRYQLKKKGISVSVLAPAPVYTKPQVEKTTKEKLGKFGESMVVPVARVGEIAVKRTLKKKMIIVPGTVGHIVSGVLRIVPKRWVAAVYNKLGDK